MEVAEHKTTGKTPQCHIMKTVSLATIFASLIILNIYYIHAAQSARIDFSLSSEADENVFNLSTCNQSATQRGPHQNVVSFSFYGKPNSFREYFPGILENAQMMKKFYPGWVMRVYHDVSASDVLTTLQLNRVHEQYKDILDTCYVGDLPNYGNMLGSQQNMWRFLTLSDPLVDVSIFRDLDSTLNERETVAVKEWLDSNYTMHVMRDHPYHSSEILAGMWGVKLNSGYRELWKIITNDLVAAGKKAGAKGKDQQLLAKIVWPLAHQKSGFLMQHDSYSCNKQEYSSAGGMRPFPKCRNTTVGLNFVGSRRKIDVHPLFSICPAPCRPQNRCKRC